MRLRLILVMSLMIEKLETEIEKLETEKKKLQNILDYFLLFIIECQDLFVINK